MSKYKYVCDRPCVECGGDPCKQVEIPENDLDKPCPVGEHPKWVLINRKARFLEGFDNPEHTAVEVEVSMPECPEHEVIINSQANFEAKKAYYDKAYTDDLELKSFPAIKIVGYKFIKKTTAKERVENELMQLRSKHELLKAFIGTEVYNNLTYVQQFLLQAQLPTMDIYIKILESRLSLREK